jgi:hypothetical protein
MFIYKSYSSSSASSVLRQETHDKFLLHDPQLLVSTSSFFAVLQHQNNNLTLLHLSHVGRSLLLQKVTRWLAIV